MEQPGYDKVELLFEEAIDLPTLAERMAFLDRACAGNPTLRQQVEELLHAHQEAGTFLRTEVQLGSPRPPDEAEAGTPKVGDHVGPYQLLGLIGEGASSTVYMAEQEHPFHRWVALKIIKAGMDTRQVIARFELERQALAVMDHPGIAKVLDAGEAPNGRPFFAMELVRGLEITQHCDQHRLTVPQRLELFIQVCQAVLHAHQKGILHRDIKPENILVTLHDGRAYPKVIDFGIAKVLHGWSVKRTPQTSGVPFLGTPAYMSPEQAQMTTPDLDTRTDIYSLGALLYELLTGHPPFDHQTLMAAGLDEMCQIIRTREPVAPSVRFAQLPAAERQTIASARQASPEELGHTITGDLEWITLKAIEKDREQRYETAASLVDDIRRHLDHLPVSAAAPTLSYRLSKLMRRNRKGVMTGAAFGLLLLASTVATSIMALHARYSARRAGGLQQAAVAAEQESRQALIEVHVSSAFTASDNGSHDHAMLWFASAARASPADEPARALNARRALNWLARCPVPVGAFQLASGLLALEFSATTQYLLALDRNGNCHVWDCTARAPLAWTGGLGPVIAAAWHPDGQQLAVALRTGQIQLRRVPDGTPLQSTPVLADLRALAFSQNGKYLLCGARVLRALSFETGVMQDPSWPHPEPVLGFGLTSHAQRIVTAASDGKARVIALDAPPGSPELATVPHRPLLRVDPCSSKTSYRQDFLEAPVLCVPVLGANGTILLTRTGPYEVTAWEVESGRVIQRIQDMCCSCRFVLGAEGTKLAAGLQGGRVGVWEVKSGRQQALITSSGACILDVAFGPDGEHLLTAQADGVARVWSLRQNRGVHSAMHHPTEVDKVAYAPNGKLVATVQTDGLVRVWRLPQTMSKGHLIASAPGPKVMRLDPERRHFVATREPAWKAEMRTTAVYAAQTGQPVGPTIELTGDLEDVALSTECLHAAVAYSLRDHETDGILEFRDVRTGRVTGQIRLPSSASSLAWEPRGERVAAICHSGQLLFASPGSNAPIACVQNLESNPTRIHPFVAFTPDGTSLISLTPAAALEVRESVHGQLRYPALSAEPDGYRHFAVSDDSLLLATATRSGQVDVWHVQTGARHTAPLTHPGPVYRCHFNADASLLVTACHDGRSRLWDLRSGQLTGAPMTHPSEVYDAAFTPNGRWVLTACRDGAIRIWQSPTGQLAAPRFRVGDQAFTVDITSDGNWAVIGSLGEAIHVLALTPFQAEVRPSADDLCALAEVISGSAISQGKIRELTTKEWLEHFRELQPTQTVAQEE